MNVSFLPKECPRFIITIYVDDEPWKDIHSKIFGRDVSLPTCHTMDELHTYFMTLEYAKAKKYALNCLAMRSYVSTQLQKLLEKNLISSSTIQKIIQEFTRLGYLNDQEWIKSFVRAQLARHIGSQTIVYKLMNKGISQHEAQRWLEELADPSETHKNIQYLLKTKYKDRNLSDYADKQKVIASLARKGFDFDMIKTAINNDSSL